MELIVAPMDDMLLITLEYSLLQLGEQEVDTILIKELQLATKVQLLLTIDDDTKRKILLEIGYSAKFINSLSS